MVISLFGPSNTLGTSWNCRPFFPRVKSNNFIALCKNWEYCVTVDTAMVDGYDGCLHYDSVHLGRSYSIHKILSPTACIPKLCSKVFWTLFESYILYTACFCAHKNGISSIEFSPCMTPSGKNVDVFRGRGHTRTRFYRRYTILMSFQKHCC